MGIPTMVVIKSLHSIFLFALLFLTLPTLSICKPVSIGDTSVADSTIVHPPVINSPPTIGKISNHYINKNINIPLTKRQTTGETGKVEISSPEPQILRIGYSSSYLFHVWNTDNVEETATTYTFTASDTNNFITSVDTDEFSLLPQQSRNISVTLTVPSTATGAENTTNILTVTVQSHSQSVQTTTKSVSSQIQGNRPPIVLAKIENGPSFECTALGKGTAVLDGTDSYDPDGDQVSYVWTNSLGDVLARAQQGVLLDLPLGFHTFTLVGTDSFGASATDVAEPFEVKDTEPPFAGARFVKLSEGGNGNSTNNNGTVGKDRYRVEWGCEDSCDPNPTVDVQINGIGEQIGNGEIVELKLRRNIGNQTKWKRKPDGTLVIESRMFELRLVCRDASGQEAVVVDHVRGNSSTCPFPRKRTNVRR